MSDLALQVEQLQFAYAQLNKAPPKLVLGNVDLNLPKASRCILVGANGAGKFTARYTQLCSLPLPGLLWRKGGMERVDR